MRNRVLSAAGALALIPALAIAQQRPAQQPAQRPAAQPQRPAAQRPAATTQDRSGSIEISAAPAAFITDQVLLGLLDGDSLAIVDDNPSRAGFGGVGRVGYNWSPQLGVSAGTGFGMQSGATIIQPFLALTYTLNLNAKTSPFGTVGVGATMFRGSGTRKTSTGAHVGAGVRSMVGENLALRVEARLQYDNFSEFEDPAYNSTASAGISYFAGGGPPRDTDSDGVPDKRDRCASTPRGATVDVRGCPSDTDRDGVLNGLDRCPDTPANTPVDASGCTRDTDRDGIADNADRCANTPAGTPVDATGCPRDADRDGVADNLDRCADTPAGTPVDANGCPRDSDGDGVMDNADRCPNTPAGTTVDANGCPRDVDGDGVADNADRCPNTAAGTQVDANGCPVQRDADGDGVIDANDRCANTPSGRRVDANGCPLVDLPAVGATMILRNINFAVGGSRLSPSSMATLDQVATSILSIPNSRWEIGGYTSSVGSLAANRRLSTARALTVMRYLVGKGVPAGQLTSAGYGPSNPVAPNTTAAGRAQNRRVEIKRVQ